MHGTSTSGQDHPVDLAGYLERARSLGYRQQIHEAFARADKLSIAFVGELIIDEYCYVRVLGKSAKEPILASCELRREQFLGGVHAASLHGEWPKADDIVTADPIRKTRFVDADFGRKLFEVYDRPNIHLVEPARELFHARVRQMVASSDVVVALDFGHGLLDGRDRSALLLGSCFLAVNAQTNAGNYGYNPVTRYAGAQYVCVDEPEARLAVQDQHGSLEDVIRGLADQMPGSKIVVTRGRYGCATSDNGHIMWIPPLATGGLDTIGAGDAFLAVSAPLVAAGLDLEAAALVGNIAGAIKVGILGHQRHVTRAEIIRMVDELLPE